MKSAKSFADDFYFECATKRTSKWVAEIFKKASKETETAERIKAELTVNEKSVHDIVQRAVQREVSKVKPVSSSVKTRQTSRKTPKAGGVNVPARRIAANAAIPTGMMTSEANQPPETPHKAGNVNRKNGDKLYRENHLWFYR